MGRNLTHLPTYPYVPVFGNMHLLLSGGKALHNVILEVSDIMDKTNVPFVLWSGTRPMIILTDPHDIKMVSNNFPEKPYLYDFGKTWVGNGLATAPVHIWKHTVKGFSKALKSRSVRTYQDVYNAQAKKLVDSLKIGEPADAWKKISYTTFETILLIALGAPEIPDLIPIDEYHEAISNTFEKIVERILNVLYHPDFIFKCTKSYKDLKKSTRVLHDTTDKLFQKYQQKDLTPNDSESNRKVYRPRFKPLLDHLRDINISVRQMKSEIDTLVFAQEPIATAMLIVLLTIGSRQDIQDKLYEEVKEIFGDTNRDVTKEDLEKMVYCEGVIREALRLHPPAPIVLRNIDRDFKIKSCTLPKDGICLINIYGSGRSTRLWGADASEFKPERWIDPATPLPPLLSFSMGKRRCLGEKYAYHSLKTMIAHVVRELEFEADITKLKVKMNLLIRVYEGLDSLKIWQRCNHDSERTDAVTLSHARN
ncbi:cytochrome P450 4c21-like [Aricia agestis]|uniref:cytochrome P450 4c21-like n=1 Tax=Aricia agestis TaxID=91739 RepID=UPI001C20718F|nr:cytochrome P450 4c21-like [Aricia agestis]